ncbi:MAG: aconitate hydratase [bacterium]
MGMNVTQKLISSHLVSGKMVPGEEIAIKIDQTLTQDATGTLVYLEVEAMGLTRTRAELSASYVDHNLLQSDFRNADDHAFLQSAAEKFGIHFSRPGNGICHYVHFERFGRPGKTLVGSDSHTPTAGALGMLAIGVGGLDVALAIAGEPFHLRMPKVMGVKLTGKLPDWVSGRDVILEMLRRHTVKGGVGKVIEYYGPGVQALAAPDRATITNMGAELGATTSVFPSDERTRAFLRSQNRENQWVELVADADATYDEHDEIDLSKLEPLIACPSSPDKVKKVSEVAGTPVQQVLIGSCENSSLRDLMTVAEVCKKHKVAKYVHFEINPGSRQVLENLAMQGAIIPILSAGARIQQTGCLGCIGMGQAPGTGWVSLRTFPRNFPGRSGTDKDQVYLCSPEVAVASAVKGAITDPRDLGDYPRVQPLAKELVDDSMIVYPTDGKDVKLKKGPNIVTLPELDALPDSIKAPVILKVGDNITTDHIMPAGADILPLRSNIPAIAEHVYVRVDPTFPKRAKEAKQCIVVGGDNYGQGSSREHAALAPRFLGLRVVITKLFARIHRANLANFGILPLTFKNPADYDSIDQGDILELKNLRALSAEKRDVVVRNVTKGKEISVEHSLTKREVEMILAGSQINVVRDRTKK